LLDRVTDLRDHRPKSQYHVKNRWKQLKLSQRVRASDHYHHQDLLTLENRDESTDTNPSDEILECSTSPQSRIQIINPEGHMYLEAGALLPMNIFTGAPRENHFNASDNTGTEETHSRASSIRSKASKASMSSLKSLSYTIRSRLSHSLSHIGSVISSRNSWKSSLASEMSIKSNRLSSTADLCLTTEESILWKELIDESKLEGIPGSWPEYEEISLRNRKCCSFLDDKCQNLALCKVCGFSAVHKESRRSFLYQHWLIFYETCLINTTDRFGNTPLHYASTMGNTAHVIELMSCSTLQLHARNTSGETFLHVFCIYAENSFSAFMSSRREVLKKAIERGFDFSIRDYHGVTVASKLEQIFYTERRLLFDIAQDLLGEVCCSNSNAEQVYNIEESANCEGLTLEDNLAADSVVGIQDSAGIRLAQTQETQAVWSKIRQGGRNPDTDLDCNGDSKLLATLRNWWPNGMKDAASMTALIEKSDIHLRDRRGYTALAIAVRHGIRDVAALLLKRGANPNSRSYHQTSIVAHASTCLARAQRSKNGILYAKIMSCMVLLADHGGKALVSVYDEYSVQNFTFRSSAVGKKEKAARAAKRQAEGCRGTHGGK